MKKTLKVIVLALCILTVAVVLIGIFAKSPPAIKPAASSPAPSTSSVAPSPSVAAPSPEWEEIARWSGENRKSTDKFTVPDEWRLTWSFDGTGHFSIVAYLESGEYDKLVVNRIGSGSETNSFHQGGEYYLEITSEEAYTILIEGLY